MQVYNYDSRTSVYIGASDADLDPVTGSEWLVPAFATTKRPPARIDGKNIVFNGDNWEYRDIPGTTHPTPQELLQQFTTAIQLRLDQFAQTRHYDGILSACTYMASSNATFHAESQTCVNLRDATWAAAYVILGEVQAGTRPMPSVMSDVESELPPLVW